MRAFLLVRLVRELDYPAGPDVIEFEKEYSSVGRPGKGGRVDILVRYPQDWHVRDLRGNIYLFIECKAPDQYERDRAYIRGQLFNLSRQESPQPKYGMYYTMWLRDAHLDDGALVVDFARFPTWEDWDAEGQPARDLIAPRYGLAQRTRYANVQRKTREYSPLRRDVTKRELDRLRNDLHEIVWGGGGTNNNDVFVNLVKLLLCKIYDELETPPGQPYEFQRRLLGEDLEEEPDALTGRISDLFRTAASEYLGYSKEEVAETIPFERRKISAAKVAYVVEQLQSLSITENTHREEGDLLGEFFEGIVAQDFTQTKGQFFTHPSLVRFCIEMLKLPQLAVSVFRNRRDAQGRPSLPYIIDPSCGSGTFLVESMKAITPTLQHMGQEGGLSKRQREYAALWFGADAPNAWAREFIYGIESNADLGLATKVNMVLHGDGSTNVFVESGLAPFSRYRSEGRSHVLGVGGRHPSHPYRFALNEQFDAILTNPPFSITFSNDEKRNVERSFALADTRSSENLFVERWYQLLREGGRLAAILPESVLDTGSNLSIRLFLYKYFRIDAVVALPYVAFKPFTSTKTCVLIGTKKSRAEVERWESLWRDASNRFQGAMRALRSDVTKARVEAISTLMDRKVAAEELDSFLAGSGGRELAAILNSPTTWLFSQVVTADQMDYSIFMAEPESVGYKRRKGLPDLAQRNDLYVEADLRGHSPPATGTVLSRFRNPDAYDAPHKNGFWVQLSDLAARPSLRADPKYVYLWVIKKGIALDANSDLTTLRKLLVPTESAKISKGVLAEPRTLIDLADVEARTSLLLSPEEVEEIGSDRIAFDEADLAISRLEPYLGKVLRVDSEANWIGSPEWLTYRVSACVSDVEYLRFLLLMPEMLDCYRRLQSGKRHARFVEDDFLDLRVPKTDEDTQKELAAISLGKQGEILELRALERIRRSEIDEAFHAAFRRQDHPEILWEYGPDEPPAS